MTAPARASALYVGHTTHTRRQPAVNRFTYSLFMASVDLAELEARALDCWPVFSSRTAFSLASVLARDHLGPASENARPLSERLRDIVHAHVGVRPAGPVRLLTGMRLLGLEFNPVSFYYVLDAAGTRVETLVAEVNNIPWFERHLYVLSPVDGQKSAGVQCADGELVRFSSHCKAFHVSPFMPIEGVQYDWLVSKPADHLGVRIGLSKDGNNFFIAALDLARRPFSLFNILVLLVTFPLMHVKVVVGIMYEAVKLYLHGAFTFFPHPSGAETPTSKAIAAVIQYALLVKARFSHSPQP
jgi:uncharacterized protein